MEHNGHNWECTAPYGEGATSKAKRNSCTKTKNGKLNHQQCIETCNTGKGKDTRKQQIALDDEQMEELVKNYNEAEDPIIKQVLLQKMIDQTYLRNQKYIDPAVYALKLLAAGRIAYQLNKKRLRNSRQESVFIQVQKTHIEYINDIEELSPKDKVLILDLLSVTYELMIRIRSKENYSDANVRDLLNRFREMKKKVDKVKKSSTLGDFINTLTSGLNEAAVQDRPALVFKQRWFNFW
jgi:hypothetical protein